MIQTIAEQTKAAKGCGAIYCCLGMKRRKETDWSWFIDLATNSSHETDQWFVRQTGLARVWKSNGSIVAAK